jgi:hypothetical protein
MTAARRAAAAGLIALFPGHRQAMPGTRPPRSKMGMNDMKDMDDRNDATAPPGSPPPVSDNGP